MNKDRIELTELIYEFAKFKRNQEKLCDKMFSILKELDKRMPPSFLTDVDDEEDEMYDQAKELVLEIGRASTSYLQRKLKVGYARSSRLMDMLEKRGVIGKAKGASPRLVLIK